MLGLIYEYKLSRRELKKRYSTYDREDLSVQELEDKELIEGMISDLNYAIDWLTTGRMPYAKRGYDKKGVYLTDPQILDKINVEQPRSPARELTDWEKNSIEEALCTLTKREKDAFILVKAEGLSYEYAAKLMNVSKGTLQSYVERATKKINQRMNESLFLVI